MPWVITKLCRDCVDMSCVEVCPVDCIYEYTGDDRDSFPEPALHRPGGVHRLRRVRARVPVGGDLRGRARAGRAAPDIALNAAIVETKAEFQVPEVTEKDKPSQDEIAANKAKWGFTD